MRWVAALALGAVVAGAQPPWPVTTAPAGATLGDGLEPMISTNIALAARDRSRLERPPSR